KRARQATSSSGRGPPCPPAPRSPAARNADPPPGAATPRAAAARTRTAAPPLAPAYHASRAVPPTLRPASIPPEGARTALLEPGRRTGRAADLTRPSYRNTSADKAWVCVDALTPPSTARP